MKGAELEITRADTGRRDRRRAYKVVVNGERRGEIRAGETRKFAVEAGELEVYLKIDWCRSRKQELRIEPGATARMVCGSRSAWTGMYGATIGFRDYMWLEPAAA